LLGFSALIFAFDLQPAAITESMAEMGAATFGDRDILLNQSAVGGLSRSLKRISLDLKILKHKLFLELVEYGKRPELPEKGRANPFAIY
jgi:hypothetical protein